MYSFLFMPGSEIVKHDHGQLVDRQLEGFFGRYGDHRSLVESFAVAVRSGCRVGAGQRTDESCQTACRPEVDVPEGKPRLQCVVAIDLVALAEHGNVMRRQRHDDLVCVGKAHAIKDSQATMAVAQG